MSMTSPILIRPTTEQLAEAIAKDHFVMFYQPKFTLPSQKMVGVEALIRWKTAQKLILPDQFIPLAEETDLIQPLTELVISKVIHQIGEWKRKNLKWAVSINLSAKNLNDLTWPDKIEVLSKKNEIHPSQVTLEITETAAMRHPPDIVIEILSRFRQKGFLLSIDDFGTGFSSIKVLQQMPFNELKIDRCFVTKLSENKSDQIITRATINLAHELGLQVVAEGVETKETLDLLTAWGCDMVQGYLFSKPLPSTELLESRLRNRF